MPEQVIRFVTPIKAKWDALTRRQKIWVVSLFAAVLLALVLFLYFTFRPRWVAMYEFQNWHQLTQVSALLEQRGIRSTISSDGRTLYVPERNAREAQGVIFASDSQVASQMPLADALDLTNLGTTEAERSAILLSAAESRIRDMLLFNLFISDAIVRITPADRNLMLRPNQPRAALGATIIATKIFSANEGRLLAEMMRTHVLGLELDNITILDQHGNAVFTRDMINDNGGVNDVWQQRNRQEQDMVNSIALAWGNAFDDVIVGTNFVYEDRIDETIRITEFAAPVGTERGLPVNLHTSQSEAEGVFGLPWGPGMGANQLTTPAYMMGDPALSSASARDYTANYRHNVMEQQTHRGPGAMLRDQSTIAVMATFYTDVCENTFFNNNPNATGEDWRALVEATPRHHNANAGQEVEVIRQWVAAATGIPIENVAVTIQQIFTIVHAEETDLPIATIFMFIVLGLFLLLLLIYILVHRKEEEEEELEPELSVEDLLATTQLEEAKDEEARLKEIEYESDNEIKKQIDKFVTEKPEAVAVLLRNWLNAEEW
jgi:flagellar M-ring protein FliF